MKVPCHTILILNLYSFLLLICLCQINFQTQKESLRRLRKTFSSPTGASFFPQIPAKQEHFSHFCIQLLPYLQVFLAAHSVLEGTGMMLASWLRALQSWTREGRSHFFSVLLRKFGLRYMLSQITCTLSLLARGHLHKINMTLGMETWTIFGS